MYTRVLELKAQSQFGDDLNPLWQMCGYQNNPESLVPCESQLIPVDTLSDLFAFGKNHLNSKAYFQIYLNSPNLTEIFLREMHKLGMRVQIWFDSPLEEEKVKHIKSLELDHIEWVYCPRLLYHPSEVFPKSLRPLFQNLVIHLNPKMQSQDSWPDLHTIWGFWHWIRNNLNLKACQMQTFAHVLDLQSDEIRLFLLNPKEKSWQVAVKSFSKLLWTLQLLTDAQFFLILKRKALVFSMYKIYYFFEFQFKKRILRRPLK